MSSKRLALASLVAALVSACGGGGTDGPTPASIAVTPPSPLALSSIGQTQQLTPAVKDANGATISGFTFTYNSTASTVAGVGTGGLVTAVANGSATIVIAATGTSLTTNYTVNVAQAAAGIAKTGGDTQSGLTSSALSTPIKVKVTDALGAAVPGVAVAFAAQNGGSVSAPSVNTNASGEAQVTWTLGPAAGSQTATATVTGLSPATFTANAATSFYNIAIQNAGPAFSAQVQTALNSAVNFWQSAIIGDESDIATGTIPNACGTTATVSGTVDDLLIIAVFDSIDGPNGVLGNAGPCYIRTASYHTVVGVMQFDTADVAGLIADGSLNLVMMHEMGHVIGFSTGIWNVSTGSLSRTCAVNVPRDSTGTGTAGLDSYFTCTFARTTFDSIGGTSFTGGTKVPLENCTGLPAGTPCSLTGTIYSHWRESSFGNELMTGYLNAGANPASVVTIASFKDIGYQVNYGAAQAYTHTFTAPAFQGVPPRYLGDDVLRLPIRVLDPSGRVVRVIRQ